MRNANPQKGFTLIEAVVAASVFAFIVSSIVGVYISTLQLDRKSRGQRAVMDNSRFIMEFLAKEVRNGSIDYSAANSCVLATTTLCVINQGNDREKFNYVGQNIVLTKNGGSSTNLNSGGVQVTKLLFYVSPAGDPYTQAKTYNEQPRVTVVMELKSNYAPGAINTAVINVQDTFTTRTYPSRQ